MTTKPVNKPKPANKPELVNKPEPVRFTKDDLERISSAMKKLADSPLKKPEQSFSKVDAVAYLMENIKQLFSKGWTYQQVASFLTESGIEISTTSLATYLHRLKYRENST